MPAWQRDIHRAGIHTFSLEVLPLEDLLFRLRKENKISLKRAAEELGISAYRYQQYETKGSKPVPDLEERKKLAKLFGAQEELLIKAERLPLKRLVNRKRGPDNITKI